jgi:hypothetical protein
MTHEELCYATAKWSITPPAASWLALYEYQSYASQEFPDVLTYHGNGTTLYEIKMSHSDFIVDQVKPARALSASYRIYSGINDDLAALYARAKRIVKDCNLPRETLVRIKNQKIHMEAFFACYRNQDKTFQQAPHLGESRFYVCPKDIIKKEEVPEGWGLIYLDDKGKFRQILPSGKWKANVKVERDIIAHALRKLGNGVEQGILIHKW